MDRALAKRDEDRFASAADFAVAMQAVLAGATAAAAGSVRAAGPRAAADRAATAPRRRRPPAARMPRVQRPLLGPRWRLTARRRRQDAGARAAHGQTAGASRSAAGDARKVNVALLVTVGVGFLLLGVGLAVTLMKLFTGR